MIKDVTKTISNETKQQKEWHFSSLLGTLGVNLLENLLTGTIRLKGTIRAGEEIIRADQDF